MVHRSQSMLGLDCHHTKAARCLVKAQREGLRNVDNSHFLCFIHRGIGSMNTLITPVCQMTGPASQNSQLWCCETVQVALQICKKILARQENLREKWESRRWLCDAVVWFEVCGSQGNNEMPAESRKSALKYHSCKHSLRMWPEYIPEYMNVKNSINLSGN